MRAAYDTVIIGSGFGGAIPAYRLAAARRAVGRPVSVCVLERGKRYNLGEFPRDVSRPEEWFWRYEGKRGWRGLIDFRTFDNISVGCASGVGGTSLVYLDVQIDAFPATLRGNPRWPRSVDWLAELQPYYRRLEEMLRPSPIPRPVLKTLALKEAADGVGEGRRFRLLDLAVYWGRGGGEQGVYHEDPYARGGPPQFSCSNCGECFIGCNTHSKNTLDLNYLYLAEKAGAEVFSQHQAVCIRPEGSGYAVEWEDLRWGFRGSVKAKRVIVAAGCLGSTELLLRCKFGWGRGRRRVAATLPRLGDMLGRYFSGNGDFGAMACKAERLTPPMVGPTITATLDFGDRFGGRGFLVEDGGFPDFLRASLKRVPGGLASGRRWLRVLKNLFGGATDEQLVEGIFNRLDFETVRDALVYLCMGIDQADGEMSIDEDGCLHVNWARSSSVALWREIERTVRELSESPAALNGNLMVNPTWAGWKHLITVHPLGGCPMGDDPTTGVVSPEGEAFGYPNLYVTDASIVPSAVGPNPSKTIGALAERISAGIIAKGL